MREMTNIEKSSQVEDTDTAKMENKLKPNKQVGCGRI